MGCREGLGFRVPWDVGFKVEGGSSLGFRVWDIGFKVEGGFRV